MVQPSRTSLNALTALVRLQPSPLPSSLSSRLAIALQSFHPSSPSTSAQIPWSAFHPILQDVLAALPAGSQQRDEFRALLVRVEGEMKGEEKKEEVLSHSSGGQSGMVEMKSNGLVPGPAEADEETQEIEQGTAAVTLDPPAPQDQLPEVEIPPTLLPLILSALSSTASNLAAKERKELGNVSLLTTLALKPTLILPPGKTLASLLSLSGAEEEARERKRKRRVSEGSGDEGKERRGEGVGGLEERVGKMMRKAFWDDATDKLLAPAPNPSLRIALLQADLSTAFSGILTPTMLKELFPVPTQETVWDRTAFSEALKGLLSQAKSLCAPVRDEEVLRLQRKLNATMAGEAVPGAEKDATAAVLEVVQGVLELAESMKSDLQTLRLLSIPPSSLPSLVASLARSYERSTILASFPPPFPSLTTSLPALLLETVLSPHAISLPSPPPALPSQPNTPAAPTPTQPNTLPPAFIGSSTILFHLQNQLQAILITASLLALSPAPSTPTPTGGPSLASKLYALLLSDLHAPASPSHTHLEDLTLILLSQPRDTPPSEADESQLRAAVQRVLRTEDPVWGLLVRRVKEGLGPLLGQDGDGSGVPGAMRTGFGAGRSAGTNEATVVKVKGFEGETLEKALGEVLAGLKVVDGWVRGVWGKELTTTSASGAAQGV